MPLTTQDVCNTCYHYFHPFDAKNLSPKDKVERDWKVASFFLTFGLSAIVMGITYGIALATKSFEESKTKQVATSSFAPPLVTTIQPKETPPPLVKRKIVVLSIATNGYGDLAFGLKVAQYLQSQFPSYDIVLATDFPEKAEHLNDEYKQSIITSRDTEDYDPKKGLPPEVVRQAIAEFAPALILCGPVVPRPATFVPYYPAESSIPLLPVVEYSHGEYTSHYYPNCRVHDKDREPDNKDPYISGLGANDHGIIVDETLRAWAKQQQAPMAVEYLQQLPKPMQRAIELPLENQALFMGYSAFPLSKVEFIFAICTMLQTQSSATNPCFCLIGPKTSSSPGGTRSVATLIRQYQEKLAAAGVACVELINLDSSSKSQTMNLVGGQGGRTIRIILQQRLSSLELKALLKLSEKEVLTTGDQFFSECISANKHWMREYITHKIQLNQDCVSLALETDELFGASMALALPKRIRATHIRTLFKEGRRLKGDPMPIRLANFFLASRKKPEHFTQLNNHICTEKSLLPWIGGKVREVLQ